MFVIIGKENRLLYQHKLPKQYLLKDESYLSLETGVYASLDVIDLSYRNDNSLYLSLFRLSECREFLYVDRAGKYHISCFVTPGNTKLLLVHLNKPKEMLRGFFLEVYELYVKQLMSPFYVADTTITSKKFDERVIEAAKYVLSP